MKFTRFSNNGETMYGVLEGEKITRLSGDFLQGNAEKLNEVYSLQDVQLLPPVIPGKIIAIGLNYVKHAEESNKPIPEEPMMFMVSPSAVVGQDDQVILPTLDHRIDYEAELAIVIGQEAKGVKKDEALSFVFGYTCANDISDRDLQKKDIQYTRAKSFHTFKPLGPVIETSLDPNNVEIKLFINGDVRQHSNTNDLIHNVETIIEKVTEVMTLYPGDVILSGTPSGVGPLHPGDLIEVTIEGIGVLKNTVQG
ncbi:2-keto-4-pentenoate hydratase/2-oxohepta-3-ene-1,7-dioic acid hydratase (catechol pathway) [Desulfotomaculum arcticum]|uniref:2-keto-4-pentenoate hydratase/2-oxohepta-3-ene-1,7-dioic acid hydratase (Catechol pathway) n=1 Tax=Desulfotruncus arcticus DSM 17038 TaxID=1121424 RepID=A0A1I2WNH9_9FIRM|nr:fumarylacetoacetate hydrolase family protein [Desulfotruncus arcticus]SFH02825.1 2-keto-4-pentenoate hydratase/2-oxohepta-3-ene-1,7-dioic acid hydratase (catechol pathway) [Desulfotomaculum arcticum] [Desulfotruncus arcticus DSM 17038]